MSDGNPWSAGELVDLGSVLFSAGDLGEAQLKRLLFTEFVKIAPPGTYVHRDGLEELVADLGLGLNDEELDSLLKSTGLWEWRGEELRLRETVELNGGIDELGRRRTRRVNVSEFVERLSGVHDAGAITPTEIALAVRDAIASLWAIAEDAALTPSGLPTTFWSTTAVDNRLVPLGNKPSAITVLDIVNSTFEAAADFPDEVARRFIAGRAAEISKALDRCGRYVLREPGAFEGLLYIDGDDDFVEEGLLPNVPSTAHFVRALAAEQTWRSRLNMPERADAHAQVQAGANFLLRMQRPNGLWGVYHYDPPVAFEAPAHPYFTLIAVRAIVAGLPLLADKRVAIAASLKKARDGLAKHIQVHAAQPSGGSAEAILVQFLEAAEACLALALACEGLASISTSAEPHRVASGHFHTMLVELGDRWAALNWRGDESHGIDVHAPGPEGYLRPIQWEQAAHGKLIYYLFLLRKSDGFKCSTNMSRKVDEIVGKIFSSREGSLWADINLANAVFPSNSTILYLALEKWLSSLPELVHDAIQPTPVS